jgi:hypothetical protein
VAFAWDQVERLFRGPLGQTGTIVGIPVSHFAAAASAGMALVMLVLSKYSNHYGVAAASTIWAVAYIAVTFFLVFVGWLLGATSDQQVANAAQRDVSIKAIVQNMLNVMPFLPMLGSAAVIILAGMGLACFGTLIGTSKNPSAKWATENRARSHLMSNFGKVVVTLASVGFSIWFGTTVLGVNAALAAVLGLVLDVGLITSWMKSTSAAEEGDWEEAQRWRRWAFVFGGAVALMAFESIGTQFKLQAAAVGENGQPVGAISPQLASVLASPLFGWLQTIGSFAIMGAVTLSVIQLLVTMPTGKKARVAADEVIEGEARDRVPAGNRIAGAIRSQRAAWSDARDALAGRPAPQLEAGRVMASESVPEAPEVEVVVVKPSRQRRTASEKAAASDGDTGAGASESKS